MKFFKKKQVALDKFRKEEDTLITFSELEKIPLNVVTELYENIKGAVEFTRIASNNDNLMFTVTMKKGQLWEKHNHDCEETILLYQGKLEEILKNKELKSAQTMTFKPYEKHYVVAKEDSVFYVEFKKPLK